MDLHKLADAMDALRIIPRAMLAVYMYLLLDSSYWFMHLDTQSTQQAAYIGAIITAGAAWFKIYVDSGPKRDK